MISKDSGKKKLKLKFCAGVGSVTGANFLLSSNNKKILIDCGLTQGTKLADDVNWQDFLYDPKEIDILFITHAHIDHIGRIPKLYNDGFRGRIISTVPTMEITRPMLLDTVGILGRDKENGLDEIYNDEIIEKVLSLWEGVEYHQKIDLDTDYSVRFLDAGHILGSGMAEFTYNGTKILFTGDLGNSPSPLLPDTEAISAITYMVMESVYGDRVHEDREERKKKLESVIEDNYKQKGVLVIPTFSLERTQELLYEINDLVENKRIPQMPIYLDSPLGIRLTTIYKKCTKYFNAKARELIDGGDDIFSFPGLHVTLETEDSKEILHAHDPKIIIAGSGMSNGGRILHHELNYLPGENNTLLLTGYQAAGTMGRMIEDGAKTVTIMHEQVAVKAHVVKISGYSGHKDSDALVNFVEQISNEVKKVFPVMGETSSSLFLAQRLRDYLGVDAYVPSQGEEIELEF